MTNTQMLTNDQIEARLRSALHRRAEIEVPDTATPPPVHWPVDELAVRRRQGLSLIHISEPTRPY